MSDISHEVGQMFEVYLKAEIQQRTGLQVLSNVYFFNSEINKIHEVDLMVFAQGTIYVLECKNYSGTIYGTVASKYWSVVYPNGSTYKLYNPILQNNKHIELISKVIESKEYDSSKVMDFLYPVSCTGQRKIAREFNSLVDRVNFFNKVLSTVNVVNMVVFPDETVVDVVGSEFYSYNASELVDVLSNLKSSDDTRIFNFFSSYQQKSNWLKDLQKRCIGGYRLSDKDLQVLGGLYENCSYC